MSTERARVHKIFVLVEAGMLRRSLGETFHATRVRVVAARTPTFSRSLLLPVLVHAKTSRTGPDAANPPENGKLYALGPVLVMGKPHVSEPTAEV